MLFEIWYELGLVGALAGAVALYASVRGTRDRHPSLRPGIMASFAAAFMLACLGIGLGFLIPYMLYLNHQVTLHFDQLRWQLPTR